MSTEWVLQILSCWYIFMSVFALTLWSQWMKTRSSWAGQWYDMIYNWPTNQRCLGLQISSIRYELRDCFNQKERPRKKMRLQKNRFNTLMQEKTLMKEITKFQASKVLWPAVRQPFLKKKKSMIICIKQKYQPNSLWCLFSPTLCVKLFLSLFYMVT